MWGATYISYFKNAFKKHPLQNRTNVQIKGGGSKAFWTMFKKTSLFPRDGFPKLAELSGREQAFPFKPPSKSFPSLNWVVEWFCRFFMYFPFWDSTRMATSTTTTLWWSQSREEIPPKLWNSVVAADRSFCRDKKLDRMLPPVGNWLLLAHIGGEI